MAQGWVQPWTSGILFEKIQGWIQPWTKVWPRFEALDPRLGQALYIKPWPNILRLGNVAWDSLILISVQSFRQKRARYAWLRFAWKTLNMDKTLRVNDYLQSDTIRTPVGPLVGA